MEGWASASPCTFIGGVKFDPESLDLPEVFSAKVSTQVMALWEKGGSKHPVFQAELLPVLVAVCTWTQVLGNRDVIAFLDNDAARHALVRGYSPIPSAAELVGETWLSIARCGARIWFARVPSGSNPADAPSRGEACPDWKPVQPSIHPEAGGVEHWLVA